MNLGDMTERCKRRFRDLDNVFVLDETWVDNLNAGLSEIRQAARWPFQMTSSNKVLAANTHSVTLTTGELEFLDDVYDVTGDRALMPMPETGANPDQLTMRNRLFLQQQHSQPIFYQINGETLFVFPAPRLNDHTIRVYFYAQDGPLLVNSEDVPDIPERFHDAIVSHACAKASVDDGMYDQASAYRDEFNRILEQAYTELRPKSTLRLDLDRKLAEIEAIRGGGRQQQAAGG